MLITPCDSWYGDQTWSDLTLLVADGRRVPVHRIVLCSRNEYFDQLIGMQSSAAVSFNTRTRVEARWRRFDTGTVSTIDATELTDRRNKKRKAIKLQDDDPIAVLGVVRYIYGWTIREIEGYDRDEEEEEEEEEEYRADIEATNNEQEDYCDDDGDQGPFYYHYYLINLLEAAVKFLEPTLAADLEVRLNAYACQLIFDLRDREAHVDEVCAMLVRLHETEERPETMDLIMKVALLVQQHAHGNQRFRGYLLDHPQVAIQLLETAPLKK